MEQNSQPSTSSSSGGGGGGERKQNLNTNASEFVPLSTSQQSQNFVENSSASPALTQSKGRGRGSRQSNAQSNPRKPNQISQQQQNNQQNVPTSSSSSSMTNDSNNNNISTLLNNQAQSSSQSQSSNQQQQQRRNRNSQKSSNVGNNNQNIGGGETQQQSQNQSQQQQQQQQQQQRPPRQPRAPRPKPVIENNNNDNNSNENQQQQAQTQSQQPRGQPRAPRGRGRGRGAIDSQQPQQPQQTQLDQSTDSINSTSSTQSQQPQQQGQGRGRGGRGRGRGGIQQQQQNAQQTPLDQSTDSIGSNNSGASNQQSQKPKRERKPRQPRPQQQSQTPNQQQPTQNDGKDEETEREAALPTPSEAQKFKTRKNQQPAQHQVSKTVIHSNLASELIDRLQRGAYECMVCTEVVKRHVAVWNCQNCFNIFHLYCMKKWTADKATVDWICPACQFHYVGKPTPLCYCGKVKDPVANAYLVPHSCGEICGKKLACGRHSCTMLCHPGPCGVCTLPKESECFCGKTKYQLKCGDKDLGRSCGSICAKDLSCGRHSCQSPCHAGPCEPCKETQLQTCYCNQTKAQQPCGTGELDVVNISVPAYFACGKVCNKLLKCGNHRCTNPCHKGACPGCKFSPEKVVNCACGKIPLALLTSEVRKQCTDEIATCPNVCEKPLPCGHKCPEKCHTGACAPCKQNSKQSCRCGSSQFTIPCAEFESAKEKLTCKKACKAMRNCGRHQCSTVCCPAAAQNSSDPEGRHICKELCNKKLKCGHHFCDMLCHNQSTKCPPCHITIHERWVCECGKTALNPPYFCGTKRPKCGHACTRPRACGHIDGHLCHDKNQACPPCELICSKICAGKHQLVSNVLCRMEVSCGRTCNNLLCCKDHPCKRICHIGPCQPTLDESKLDPNVPTSCGSQCGRKRACGHKCSTPCHPTLPTCPNTPCTAVIKLRCPCGRRILNGPCGAKDQETQPRELLCDDQCEVEKRNKKLAEAFGIDLNKVGYEDSFVQLARMNLQFVQRLESKLDEFVKSQNSRLYLPTMDRVHRRIVHEYMKYYEIDSQSIDQEPNRSVLLTKRPATKIPPMLLSQQATKIVTASGPALPNDTILHVYDLTPEVNNMHIIGFLNGIDGYKLKWLDPSNLLIICVTPLQLIGVVGGMAKSPYKFKMYRPEPTPPVTAATTASKTAAEKQYWGSDSETSSEVGSIGPVILKKEEETTNTTTSTNTNTTTTSAPTPTQETTTTTATTNSESPKIQADTNTNTNTKATETKQKDEKSSETVEDNWEMLQ